MLPSPPVLAGAGHYLSSPTALLPFYPRSQALPASPPDSGLRSSKIWHDANVLEIYVEVIGLMYCNKAKHKLLKRMFHRFFTSLRQTKESR
ncbi:hypothetical protein GUJ93_ZPchr0004g39227 [Zizania palustris]|uniref:Uncharacterized protein n=1 Tax=Zizania palustris TaxID=103762 RepID=A0A8J5VFZ1_ZIZPA|nr:hypothetical protein GUJ93_ZPchr0004g39227 [Zizania palustris]